MVIRERALPPEWEEEGAHEEDEFEDVEEEDEERQHAQPSNGPVSDPPPPPFTQSQPSPHFDMGRSSFTPHMPFDATFLQSFASLQMNVPDLQEECNAMQSNLHHMTGRMDSIEGGVMYF